MEGKLKYYFKKPKGAITKDLLLWAAFVGVVMVVGGPSVALQLFHTWAKGKKSTHAKRSVNTAFYRLRKKGLIAVEQKGHRCEIHLTDRGKHEAGWIQLDSLEITKPKQWKGGWYLLLFDIYQVERWKRDALRGFLERLGLQFYQKSAWIHPYNPSAELEVLKEFLGLTSREVKLLFVQNLSEDESYFRRRFKLV